MQWVLSLSRGYFSLAIRSNLEWSVSVALNRVTFISLIVYFEQIRVLNAGIHMLEYTLHGIME
jgi:hypothetical protein